MVQKHTQWSDDGIIELSTSQLGERVCVLKPLPSTEIKTHAMSLSSLERLRERANDKVFRCEEMVPFATTSKCLAAQLAAHFGRLDPNGEMP